VATTKNIPLRNTTLCEQPLIPLRGRENATHWRLHPTYRDNMGDACWQWLHDHLKYVSVHGRQNDSKGYNQQYANEIRQYYHEKPYKKLPWAIDGLIGYDPWLKGMQTQPLHSHPHNNHHVQNSFDKIRRYLLDVKPEIIESEPAHSDYYEKKIKPLLRNSREKIDAQRRRNFTNSKKFTRKKEIFPQLNFNYPNFVKDFQSLQNKAASFPRKICCKMSWLKMLLSGYAPIDV
jgi:hypothetical protein